MNEVKNYTYTPSAFDMTNIDDAKEIILTEKNGRDGPITTEMRWHSETDWFMTLIERHCQLNEKSVVLDYGCGVGRMAKPLIKKYNCRVVGIDMSPTMRRMALDYTPSENFMVVSPLMWDILNAKYDLVLGLWVLLHCLTPEHDIDLIREAMKPGTKFIVANDDKRVVPTTEGEWVDDFIDIKTMLVRKFRHAITGNIDITYPGRTYDGDILRNTFWGVYTK